MYKFQQTGLLDAVIEIPMGSHPIKYEIDKVTGGLKVDRILSTAIHFPTNYGYIPDTLGGDGDPVDVILIAPYPLQPLSHIECRPIGMLNMVDEAGSDVKVLAVPSDKVTREYSHIKGPNDLGDTLLNKLKHFFQHYKDLEPNKWVEIKKWGDGEDTKKEIIESYIRWNKNNTVQMSPNGQSLHVLTGGSPFHNV